MKLSSTLIAASCILLSTSTTAVSSVELKNSRGTSSSTSSSSSSTTKTTLASKNLSEFVQYLQSQKVENAVIESLTEIRHDFAQWTSEFDKVYHSLEEEVERMLIWLKNHEFIHAHNNRTPASSYTVGHNQFSDVTNDEFRRMHSLGEYSHSSGVGAESESESAVDALRAARRKRAEEKAAAARLRGDEGEGEHPMVAEYRYLRSLAVGAGGGNGDGDVEGIDDWFNFDDKMFNDDGSSYTDDAETDDDTSPTTDDTSPTTDDGTSPTTDDDSDTNGLPDAVDWVASGAVTPVKNQQSCGSCWAFSSTGAIEGASFVKYGQLVSLSEQNLLDCDTVDNGCSGGLMENAFKYDESAKGLCSEADYPYLATDGHECSAVSCQKVNGTAVADYIDIDEKDKHGLIASIVLQPTSIAMQADQLSFQFYNSGVFDDEECGASGAIDHGVLAVGYGTDEETGKKYFTVKNSWGDSWGENGYVRLSRSSKNDWGTCAILMIMTAPIIA